VPIHKLANLHFTWYRGNIWRCDNCSTCQIHTLGAVIKLTSFRNVPKNIKLPTFLSVFCSPFVTTHTEREVAHNNQYHRTGANMDASAVRTCLTDHKRRTYDSPLVQYIHFTVYKRIPHEYAKQRFTILYKSDPTVFVK